MDFIFIAMLFVIFIIFISWYIIEKFLLDYFVIEINKDLTVLKIYSSWFFQKDLLLLVRAEKITIRNPKRIEIDGLVEIKKIDSKKADCYFKFSQSGSDHQLIEISDHSFCRYVC